MPQTVFISMPVKDLARSVAFFEALGFSFDPRFTDGSTACLAINETAFAMLLPHERFAGFSPKPITDTDKSLEMLISLSRESREAVDAIVKAAVAAGGTTHDEAQDHGFMYDHGFRDLDGHAWGVFWMDPAAPRG